MSNAAYSFAQNEARFAPEAELRERLAKAIYDFRSWQEDLEEALACEHPSADPLDDVKELRDEVKAANEERDEAQNEVQGLENEIERLKAEIDGEDGPLLAKTFAELREVVAREQKIRTEYGRELHSAQIDNARLVERLKAHRDCMSKGDYDRAILDRDIARREVEELKEENAKLRARKAKKEIGT